MSAIDLDGGAGTWLTSHGRRRSALASLLTAGRALWAERSLRWQVLSTFLVINLAAAGITAALVIYNAKRATEVEIAASIAVAERFVRASISDLDHRMPGGLLLEDVLGHIGPLRHVRLLISTPSGRAVWLERPLPSAGDRRGGGAPGWFAALVRVYGLSREVAVLSAGRRIGTVLVLGDPADEIAEVWADMSGLAALAAIINLAVILLLYFAFGRVLTPLAALSQGLRQLEQGSFAHRLAEPNAPELADLSRGFNALATSLGVAREENFRLHRCLMTAQEDERRLIANELHDEMGPCLFGLRANMASLDRALANSGSEEAGRVRQRVQVLSDIADRIQGVNRRVLERLRPIALGEVPLADLLSAMVAEFAEQDGAPVIRFPPPQLDWSYGDCVDLTAYRCIQEGLTNVIRHARAAVVELSVSEETPRGTTGKGLRIVVRDDGAGIGPGIRLGMGLTGMKERIEALGGAFSISAGASGGTCLEIVLPGQDMKTPGRGGAQGRQ
jgi:two-component system, NarL family, sensor histidine kinase UhpB